MNSFRANPHATFPRLQVDSLTHNTNPKRPRNPLPFKFEYNQRPISSFNARVVADISGRNRFRNV